MQGTRPGAQAGQRVPEAGLQPTTLAQRPRGPARRPTSPSLCSPRAPRRPGKGNSGSRATQRCSPGRGRRRGCSGPRGPRSPSRAALPDLRGECTSPHPAPNLHQPPARLLGSVWAPPHRHRCHRQWHGRPGTTSRSTAQKLPPAATAGHLPVYQSPAPSSQVPTTWGRAVCARRCS